MLMCVKETRFPVTTWLNIPKERNGIGVAERLCERNPVIYKKKGAHIHQWWGRFGGIAECTYTWSRLT